MKNIIAIVSTVIVMGLILYVYSKGPAYQGGEAGRIIEDLKVVQQEIKVDSIKEKKNLEQEKLKALRDKVGNTAQFEVSNAYKSKCSSCHGVDGSGTQNGKKLMGPSLIGQSEEMIYKNLVDFKAGRKENLIMKGLLINLSDNELKNFAKEISQFKVKRDALNKN
ncbi:c-type cytochrome [Halarcobacter anaerophilus]|uniref:Cytochrome c domain-containing protein n=1 Tax=Halarcobacter anaerophilus TaxID=877500 RepID=A0A4Q0XY61_9BACT|nr:c-type cytochrome [Halarcobacter anaerophilus]QDF28177.1 monoheme c-type cytochrome [Halarcobacter anaerophilus]RXJ62522.1 hypothetical protein CRV06_10295 [Halarcobacter anaerophilus]